MEIIPAIDLMDGQCVRLVQGDFERVTVYSNDPVETALRWVNEGAQRLHLVDLKGSRSGEPQEGAVIEKIARTVDVPVQLGGGVRSLETARAMLASGVDRVIVGTSAALDQTAVREMFAELGEQVVLALDARDGYVAVKAWEELTRETAVEFARRMQDFGARRVIYTDISRDGMMQGANVAAMKRMAEALEIPVIASGGVSSLQDIRALKSLGNVGIEGAILGKALYTGDISLPDALAEAAG